MSRRKKYKVIKFMRSIRDKINQCENSGLAERLIMEFPMIDTVSVWGRWTTWVTIIFKDGSRYCFNRVNEIDAIKEASNFIYFDFIKYNVRILKLRE